MNDLKKKAAFLSLYVGLGMLVAKIGAYLLTGSAAIFSDAIESVVHIFATSMALFSIFVSSKPADDTHPYGHSNVEYFSAGIEGLLIFVAALGIIYYGINDLIWGKDLHQLDIGLIIISSAAAVNLGLGFYLIRAGKKYNSIALVANGKHVLTDSYTSFGVLIGVLLVFLTGINIIDPIFAILVGLNIIYTAVKLVRESVGGLMLEQDKELLENLVTKLNEMKKPYWIDLHELRFWKSGDKVFIDFHLILPYYFTIRESHEEETFITKELMEVHPNAQLKIHFDYCIDELCKYCDYQDCNYRKENKLITTNWDRKKLTGKAIYKYITREKSIS
ncbi:MAG: hypothetical protein C0425_10430 [Chlorobiaceae bacterium]|nr:hypothetical protein [Chlorobiaceae bacterium]MBA4310733.1 hypothetical protein [Chlorobiaceae bacterium]